MKIPVFKSLGLPWAALFFVVLAFPSHAQSADIVGEIEFHRYLWDANTAYQVEFNRANREMQEIESRYQFERSILQRERSDLQRRRDRGLEVPKDEFETTAEYEARKVRLQEQFQVTSAQRIEEIEQQLERLEEDFQRRQARVERQLEQVGVKNAVRVVADNNIFLRAEMGAYDADTERVENFQFSNYHLFQDGRVIRVFIFKGKIGGRSMPLEVAREVREASESGRLAVSLAVEPTNVRFSNSFSLRTLETPVDELEDRGIQISTRSGRREEGLVIEIEWPSEPAPRQLYIHYPDQDVWQPVFP